MTLGRRFKELSKRTLRSVFEIGQRFGVNILPHHFYSEIPDLRELRLNEYWRKTRSMIGVNGLDIKSQFDFIKECCTEDLINRLKIGDIYNYCCQENGEPGFGPVETDFLFCFIVSKRPKRIIQVGAGLSTSVILLAAKEANYQPEIICIDPYPNEFLKRSDRLNKIKLI